MLAAAVAVGLACGCSRCSIASVVLLMSRPGGGLVQRLLAGAAGARSLATLALDYFFTRRSTHLTLELRAPAADRSSSRSSRRLFVSVSAAAAAGRASRCEQAHDELDVKVRERTAELEELAGRLIHAQEQERSRIGRELHDHISQMLGVLTIGLDQLRADETTPPSVGRSPRASCGRARRGSHRGHSRPVASAAFVGARLPRDSCRRCSKLVHEFSGTPRHRDRVRARARCRRRCRRMSRCACSASTEESLTNIAKHSQAASARVRRQR